MPDPTTGQPSWMQALTALIPMATAGFAGQGTGMGAFGEQYARGAAVADELRMRQQAMQQREQEQVWRQQQAALEEQRVAREEKRRELGDLMKLIELAPSWATQATEQAMTAGAADPEAFGSRQFDDMLEALAKASPQVAAHKDTLRVAAGDFRTHANAARVRRYGPVYERLTKEAPPSHYEALLASQAPILDGMRFADLDAMMQAAGKGYVPPAPKAATPGSFEDYVTRKYGQSPTPEQTLAARKAYQQADDRPPTNIYLNPTAQADIDEMARSLVDGDVAPTQLAKRGDAYNAMLARARRLYRKETGKELSMTRLENDYQAARKFILSMNSPQMIRFNALAETVLNTINEVRMLGEELQQGGIQKWNQAKRNTILQVYGNTPYSDTAARYVGAVNTLKEEFANLAQGGYAPTESAWQLAHQQINEDFGVKDLNASLVEVRRLLAYRIGSFENQRPRLTPDDEAPAPTPSHAPTAAPSTQIGRFEIIKVG